MSERFSDRWNRVGNIHYLHGDDFFISYNPDTSLLGVDELTGVNYASDEPQETALCNWAATLILNGDWRLGYEKYVDQGYDACYQFYLEHKAEHQSKWSSDYGNEPEGTIEHVPSPESASQPRPDLIQEALAAGSFDDWLTQLPTDWLRYLYDITQQFKIEQIGNEPEIKDKPTLIRLVALAMHFSGKEGSHVPEIEETFTLFVKHLIIEIDVREGNATKVGTYSMVPEEETALFSLTEKGRQTYQLEQEQ